jgi:uncharacterized membrane protein YfhO
VPILLDDESAIELDARLDAPGLVVLADTFYPGWQATVDGVGTTIYPTNYLFRGVPVPAGAHRVRFEYRPQSVRLGAVSSGAGIALLVALGIADRRARRPSRERDSEALPPAPP